MDNWIAHYGIPHMKWYHRRYQNADGTLTEAGKRRYQKENFKNYKKEIKHKPGELSSFGKDFIDKNPDTIKKLKRISSDYSKYYQQENKADEWKLEAKLKPTKENIKRAKAEDKKAQTLADKYNANRKLALDEISQKGMEYAYQRFGKKAFKKVTRNSKAADYLIMEGTYKW